jgi:autotransporter-associated beta strand protein
MFGSRTITVGGTGKTHAISSVLSGTGGRTIAGGSTLSLTGANTFPGPLVLGDNNNSNLRLRINSIANANGTPSAAGAPANATDGILQIGSGSFPSTLELSGSTTSQWTNRRIRIGSDGTGSGSAIILNNNSNAAHTLAFTNSAFNVAATDTASFNRTLTLGGSNTGDNLIQGAIIDNLGGSGGKVALMKSDGGTWVLAGANSHTGNTAISGGTLRIGNGGTSGSLSTSSGISISSGATLEFRRSDLLTQGTGFTSGAISGSGALVQSGTGTTILNADNTYQGLTTINTGTLRIRHAGALGNTAAGTVVNGSATSGATNARLELAGGIAVSGEALTISGAGNFRGALSSQSGTNTWSGSVTIAGSGVRIGASDGASLRVSGVIDSGGLPHGLIVRAGPVDAGAVILSGANSYVGDTSVLVGKLQLDGGNNRLPVSTRLTLGNTTNIAEFDLNGRNQTLAGLTVASGVTTGTNSVNNSSATLSTLTVNTATPSTYSGAITGAIRLVKTGEDTLTLTGTNTHSGPTTVHQGTLALVGASIDSPISVGPGASLGFTLGSPAGSTSSVNLTNGTVKITGTVDGLSDHLLLTAVGGIDGTPELHVEIPGYALKIEDEGRKLVLSRVDVSAFETWSAGAAPDEDGNGDGVPNAIAWALGAAGPFEDARGLLPTIDTKSEPDYLIFSFPRGDEAQADPDTTIAVEYDADPAGQWHTAQHDGDHVIIVSLDNTTRVKLKRATLAPGGTLFARLRVVVALPSAE